MFPTWSPGFFNGPAHIVHGVGYWPPEIFEYARYMLEFPLFLYIGLPLTSPSLHVYWKIQKSHVPVHIAHRSQWHVGEETKFSMGGDFFAHATFWRRCMGVILDFLVGGGMVGGQTDFCVKKLEISIFSLSALFCITNYKNIFKCARSVEFFLKAEIWPNFFPMAWVACDIWFFCGWVAFCMQGGRSFFGGVHGGISPLPTCGHSNIEFAETTCSQNPKNPA